MNSKELIFILLIFTFGHFAIASDTEDNSTEIEVKKIKFGPNTQVRYVISNNSHLSQFALYGNGSEKYPYLVRFSSFENGLQFVNVTSYVLITDISVDCRNSPNGIEISQSANLEVKGNNITNCQNGVTINHSENITVSVNEFRDNNIAIYVSNSNNTHIDNNIIYSSYDQGIYSEFSRDMTIARNIFNDTSGAGIFDLLGENVTIQDNRLRRCGMYEFGSVTSRNTTSLVVRNNFISDIINGNAIVLDDVNNSLIYRNELSNFDFVGVRVRTISSYNTIEENVIFNIGENGVLIDNEFGGPPEGNIMKHNDFYYNGNSRPITDLGNLTVMNGNFYSDWSSVLPFYPMSTTGTFDPNPEITPNHLSELAFNFINVDLQNLEVTIEWGEVISLFNNNPVKYSLFYSNVKVPNYKPIIEGINLTTYTWNVENISTGNYIIEVLAIESSGIYLLLKYYSYIEIINPNAASPKISTSIETRLRVKIQINMFPIYSCLVLMARRYRKITLYWKL